MADLFAEITALVTLEAAWDKVKANAGACGGDRQTVADFAASAPSGLLALHHALRTGTYRPGPLRHLTIPKPDGGQRPLAIPCVVDRIAQTACAQVLTPLLDPDMAEGSFGYRPGRSVRQAVARIGFLRDQGYAWVIDADIERYFETIPHAPLLDLLRARLPEGDPLVVGLVTRWLEDGDEAASGRGLPQGSPLSPLLSNLYLDSFDDAVEDDARLVRFADDFVVLCRTEAKAHALLPDIGALLAARGLRLNGDKTRVVAFAQGFRFLGHLFVRGLTLPSPESPDDDPGERLLRELAGRDAAEAAEAARAAAAEATEEPAGWRRTLRVLYLESGPDGARRRLTLRNQAFSVEEDGRELIALPPDRVDRIDLSPDADADPEALRHALLTGTTVQFVDGHGATLGLLAPPPRHRAGLHLAQAALVLDAARRQDLARVLVAGRIHNQRALLHRLNRSLKDDAVATTLETLARLVRKPRKPSLDIPGLLGVEGEAAALYWPALCRLLRHGWTLPKRIRQPPTDPVNAVFSFTASLLTRDMEALVLRHGLHPGFGVLHGGRDGHAGCVYDLVEEFRAPLAESLTMYLFNNRLLTQQDFLPEDLLPGPAQRRAVRLIPAARRTVVRAYEDALDRRVRGPVSGRPVAWRRAMEEQVLAFARHATGDGVYAPYRLDY